MIIKPDADGWPLLIAHRGCRNEYPENTLCSFQAALDRGARMIELDVALSRDGEIIVIHDDTVDRTTNGSGHVKDMSLSELKSLDAGSWFNTKFADEKIPELREVFELVGKQARINIEIKADYSCNPPARDSIENMVVELIRAHGFIEQTLISSFQKNYLERLSKRGDTPALALLSRYPANKETLQFLEKIDAYSWHPWFKVVTEDQVELLHKYGYRVFPYTVNKADDYLRLKEMGVDGVFTDNYDDLARISHNSRP